jgi:hypothetical protein
MPRSKEEPKSLQGWQQIANFLGQPLSVAQRWAKSGMPVTRRGRYVVASTEELNRWVATESGGEPVHVAGKSADLTAELKRGLSSVRKSRGGKRKSAA